MYNRFDLAVHSNENLNNTLSVLHNNTSFLNDYAKLLKKVSNYFSFNHFNRNIVPVRNSQYNFGVTVFRDVQNVKITLK